MKFFCFALLILINFSCNSFHDKKTQHSFYYWKTTFTADTATAAFIYDNNIDHFYIHYFDVDFSYKYYLPVPVAEIKDFQNSALFVGKHYTPVIFITNKAFEQMPYDWCDSLANKVRNKIIFITNKIENNYNKKTLVSARLEQSAVDEIQIDCDWTSATQDKYFKFLQRFKQLFPDKKISATIRLYPYKYAEKMGVPPVDKGLLMCYNLSNIKDGNTKNSIFDLKDLKQYLNAKQYPLPLDIALPIFGWYAWFGGGEFKGIIYANDIESAKNDSFYFKNNGTIVSVLSDTTIGNNFLRQGDVLRMEYPKPLELEAATKLLKNKFPKAERISFYYFDNSLIHRYEKTIKNIYALY